MGKKRSPAIPILAGVIGFSLFFVIIIGQISESKGNVIVGDSGTFPIDVSVGEDCVLYNEDLTECLQYSQYSVIDVNYTIAESDDGVVDSFIEGIQGKFEQFGIEIVSAKYNLAGQSQSYSTIFPVQLISQNVVSGDFIVDNVQVAFNAVTKDTFSTFNLEGEVQFRLNDSVVKTKKLWTSSALANQQVVALNVVDSVPPPIENRKTTFDFTFTDEGFVSGDRPVFTVVVKSLKGTYQAGGETKTFDWQGEFVAYKLELAVDETKTTILNESGQAVSVKKNDSTLSSCSTSAWVYERYVSFNKGTSFYHRPIPASKTLDVEVIDSVGASLGEIKSFTTEIAGTPQPPPYGHGAVYPNAECKKITGLMRESSYTIHIDNKPFAITTPKEQHNYYVTWSTEGDIELVAKCTVIFSTGQCVTGTFTGYDGVFHELRYTSTSNFGYPPP